MNMTIERLTERIGRAVQHAQFRNVFGHRFEPSVMREFYAKKMKGEYSLSSIDSIVVPEAELTDLVSELVPMIARYTSPDTGAVGNGFYMLMGSMASPRLPSVEDYAKVVTRRPAKAEANGPGREHPPRARFPQPAPPAAQL